MTNVHAPTRMPVLLQLPHDATNCLGEGFGRSAHVDRAMHRYHDMPDAEAPDLSEGGAHGVPVDPAQIRLRDGVSDHTSTVQS